MAITFKVLEKGQPGVVGGGQKKFYAQIVLDGEVTTDELVKEIEKFSSLTEPDIRGVIIALENAIQDKLVSGKIVRLEKLGSLYPAISSAGVDRPEDVNASVIKEASVNYRPGARIKKALAAAEFNKE